jgi:Alpha-glutamyl/putrescinyl thymine pyrophosphorylase clade 3
MVTEPQRQLADRLRAGLDAFEAERGPLRGLTDASRSSLISQLVESSRVNTYVDYLRSVPLSPEAADPSNANWFNPLKAAITHHRAGEDDEAFWLVFLLTHFGRHRWARWHYVREVYGALGSGRPWTWQSVTEDVDGFRDWLDAHQSELAHATLPCGFGNHRKYESLAGWTDAGTGSVVASYIGWVGVTTGHRELFDEALAAAGHNPEAAFDSLYKSMKTVHRFGRLARFDYLTMVGRIGLADIHPGNAYLRGSTGPLKGAQLLFRKNSGARLATAEVEDAAIALQRSLGVPFDVLEDALCNWQKNPASFTRFRG